MSAPTPTLAASLARATARYGENIVQRGAQHVVPLRAHPTHLPDIDALTGYGGLPAGAITLLRGHGSSGKLCLALNMLAGLQLPRPAAIVDLAGTIDAAALHARALADGRLIVARPTDAPSALGLLSDLIKSNAVGAVLLNSLSELLMSPAVRRMFAETVTHLAHVSKQSGVTNLWLYDPNPLHTPMTASFDISSVTALAPVVLECKGIRSWADEFGCAALQVEVRCTKSRYSQGRSVRLEMLDA